MGGRSVVGVFLYRTVSYSCWLNFLLVAVVAAQTSSPSRADGKARGAAAKDTISIIRLQIPEKAREQLMKGLVSFSKNNLEDALKHANAALLIAPDFPNALTLRGYIELKKQSFELAKADLEHSVNVDPAFSVAYLYLGAVQNRLGGYDDALRSLDRHAELNPSSWETQFEMAKAWLGKRDYDRTLTAINQASALGGGGQIGAAIHYVRGRALAGLHQYGSAKVEFQNCLALESTGAMAELARELLSEIDRESTMAAK